jgi:RimJ/RimL family protein N-acetyltransferase
VSNGRARRVIEKCGFQFRETGMVRSPVSFGAVPVERFVLERRNWASLKSWGAGAREEADVARDNAA